MCKRLLWKRERIVSRGVNDRVFERFAENIRAWIFFVKLFVVKISCFIFAALWLKGKQIRVSGLC
jgi:hypothetical protein